MGKRLGWVACGLGAALVLGLAAPSEAVKKAPSNNGLAQCELDSLDGASDHDCDGLLCTCCYADGCWICNSGVSGKPADCVWDGSYSRARGLLDAGGGDKPKSRLPETRIPKERMAVDPGASPGPTQQGDGSVAPTPVKRGTPANPTQPQKR